MGEKHRLNLINHYHVRSHPVSSLLSFYISHSVSKVGLSTHRGIPNGHPVSETRGIAHREEAHSQSVSESGQSTHRGVPNGCPVRETCGIAHREGTYSRSVSELQQSTHRGVQMAVP